MISHLDPRVSSTSSSRSSCAPTPNEFDEVLSEFDDWATHHNGDDLDTRHNGGDWATHHNGDDWDTLHNAARDEISSRRGQLGIRGCIACFELFDDDGGTATITLAAVRNEVERCVFCKAMLQSLEPVPEWGVQYGTYVTASITNPSSGVATNKAGVDKPGNKGRKKRMWPMRWADVVRKSVSSTRKSATSISRVTRKTLTEPRELAASPSTIAKNSSRVSGSYDKFYNSFPMSAEWGGRLRQAPKNEVPEDPMCTEVIAKVQHWINDCRQNHVACNKIDSATLPSRYLVMDPTTEPPTVRLVEHAVSESPMERYVALSHCWGKSQMLCLTRDSLAAFIENISWVALPRTFQDAIRLSLKLGYRAIWIDSLCIKQDPDDRSDWAVGAGKMQAYYECADLVLSATRAAAGSEGFLQSRSRRSKSVRAVVASSEDEETDVHIAVTLHEALFHDHLLGLPRSFLFDPVLTRGWTFQERQLARRILHYCRDEIAFECLEHMACECGGLSWFPRPSGRIALEKVDDRVDDSPAPQGLGAHQDDAAHAWFDFDREMEKRERTERRWGVWNEAVRLYTALDLTQQSDRLPAISGIATRLQDASLGRYVAGLWERDLHLHLLWGVSQDSTAQRIGQPSWSWASVSGAVVMPPSVLSATYVARVESVDCTPATLNPYGRASTGTLVLRTLTANLRIFATASDDSGKAEGYTLTHLGGFDTAPSVDIHVGVGLDVQDARSLHEETLQIAVLTKTAKQAKYYGTYVRPALYEVEGLLLAELKDTSACMRIGVVTLRAENDAADMLRESLNYAQICVL